MRRHPKLDFEADKSVVFIPTVARDAYFKTWLPWKRECDDVLETEIPKDLVKITPAAPSEVRRALADIALMFKREVQFDFCPYSADMSMGHSKDMAFFWTTHNYRYREMDRRSLVGGCGFRWRTEYDRPDFYALQWVWFHPHFRGAKRDDWDKIQEPSRLAQAWPMFRQLFGDFRVEPPVSHVMLAFLRKMGEELDSYSFLQPRGHLGEMANEPVSFTTLS